MIPFHGTPMGGARIDVARFLRGRHAFVSFAAPEDLPIAAEVCQSFAFDNGAFSIWKRGGVLDVQGYFEWCLEWHRHPGFAWCVIPDVIDGSEDENNQLIAWWMSEALARKEGHLLLRSVPVFHLHESLGRIQKLMDLAMMYFDRIALGSSGQWSSPGSPGWDRRMAEVMQAVCDDEERPRVRLHGLRMLDAEIFTRYPLASADSTNVARNWGGQRPYKAPTPIQQAETIAARAEIHQSAAAFRRAPQAELFSLSRDEP